MNVIDIASRPRASTGPPFERLYAVEPDGAAQMTPSHGTVPRSSPPTVHAISTIRPSVPLVETTSFTAVYRSPLSFASSVGSSETTYSPAKTRARSRSRFSGRIDARKPTRPKFTPITGVWVPSSVVSARRIVPSPPRTIAMSGSSPSTTSTPYCCASARTRSTASCTSTLPCVKMAARSTDSCCDSLVEVIGEGWVGILHEVEEELPVALWTRETGVYDAGHARPPTDRRLGDVAQNARPRRRVTDDSALADVGAPSLELRLHQHDRLPARRREPQHRRQRHAHRDERHVADDELRRKRQLLERAGVRALQHDHARIVAQPRV